MEATLEAKYEEHKSDVTNLLILNLIASVLGIYLIVTTVCIAQDGVYYIERAQQLPTNPGSVIQSHPPGYPLLIFVAHKFIMLFNSGEPALTWIYIAQSVTLLCRLFALIPLYFIGKFLIGGRKSFWAVLILLILPYPAHFGSDVLRDWPHILFLAVGFLFLLLGAKQGKCWMFGVAGFAAGLGHIVRAECAQLVIYGALWILIRLFYPKHDMSKSKSICALLVLLIGFAIPAAPYMSQYMSVKGKRLPEKIRGLFSFSDVSESEKIQEPRAQSCNNTYTASDLPSRIAKAIGRLMGEISDNLMYYFVPALVIGIYIRFRRKSAAQDIERFFIPAFVFLNALIMILLYKDWQYISRRHVLPLVVFLIFYVPAGLEILAGWIAGRAQTDQHSRRSFFILLAIGVGICMPKLFRPIRLEKQGYRTASGWLSDNTEPEDIIAVPDKRITFYAQRKGLLYSTTEPEGAKYIVKIVKNKNEETDFDRTAQEEYSVDVDKRKKDEKKLVIYKMME